ncbi:MAG: ATP-binding protein [Gammaproteobacteria bacterium]|nr:ATP-binding protein [Gammaproteobacteria bacterium]MBL6999835.1 ATP-binding protein [Gammaproteobacteria bacterium]
MSDITIHIDETLDTATILALQNELTQLEGIRNVKSQEKRPHLMVINYDSKLTSSEDILLNFTSQGLHAELIGF